LYAEGHNQYAWNFELQKLWESLETPEKTN